MSSGAIGVGSKLGCGARSPVGAGAIASGSVVADGSAVADGSVVVTDGAGAERGRAGVGARTRGAAAPAGAVLAGRVVVRAGAVRSGVVGAGRVTVPFNVKSCSSRGPMVSVAGVLVAGAAVSWASTGEGAATGASASAAADAAMPKRKPALISSRSLPLNRTAFRRAPVPHGAQSHALQA